MKKRARALVVLGAIVLSCACNALFPLSDYEGVVDATEGVPDASTAKEVEAPPPDLHHVPPPPSEGEGGDESFDLIVTHFDIRKQAGKGFDLDGVQTCPGAPSCTSTTTHCDGDGGIDNALAPLVDVLANALAGEQLFNLDARIRQGGSSIIISVRGYNGEANDKSVSVRLYVADGLEPLEVPDAGYLGGGVRKLDPSWLHPGSGVVPRLSGEGYVTNGTLVFRLAQEVLPIGEVELPIFHPTFVGNLRRLAVGQYAFEDGFAVGTVQGDALLRELARHAHACNGDVVDDDLVRQISFFVCPQRDVRYGNDTLPTCNALSAAIGIGGQPVTIGEIGKAGAGPQHCERAITCP